MDFNPRGYLELSHCVCLCACASATRNKSVVSEQGLGKSSGGYRAIEMGRDEQVMAEIEGLMQGEFELPGTYGKRAWKLFLLVDEEDEHWDVENFIEGIDRYEFRRKLQAEHHGRKGMSLDAAIGRLKVLYKITYSRDYGWGARCERGLVPVERSLRYNRAWRKAVDLVQKERESVAEYFGRTRDMLPCLDPEDECWLVDVFINGLIDDSIQEALRMSRKGNVSMTLLQAYEQLEILASSGDNYEIAFNYFGNCSSEDSQTVNKIDRSTTGRCQGFRSIAVQDIPGYILVDPVAFQQFLSMNCLQPYYQVSGCYSEESIRILHDEFSQLTEEEITDVTPLMKASAKMALLQQQLRQHSLGNKIEITMMELATTNQGVASPDHNQYKSIFLEAETEPRAIRSYESARSYQNTTGGREVEKWREKTDIKYYKDREQEVIVTSLGAKGDSSAQDHVGSGWKPEAVEAPERERRAEVGNNRGTTELGNSDRPCSSNEFSFDAML